jgi:hypothetical protein
MQGKAMWQTLKSCHVDHLLCNHGSSLTFLRGTLKDHFFRGQGSMQSTWSAWTRWPALISYVHGRRLSAGLSGLVSELSGRYVHEIVHSHAHVQTDQVNFCACTCAHMHKTDLPIDTNKRHASYFIDTDEMRFLRRTFSIAAHHFKFLCTLHKKIKFIRIIPRHT